ncbi:nucleotidyltransferase [Levilactobacillus brevis]|uniref:nucleotidyltransferase n=1 Tax=Levilactobacillus brevis TaxID=1580 RepID=UPI001C1E95C6|nr:nucleotidyltransferase [Levilactobacillus brevis]MBU7539356.1 nucleotidyltransferase [Levilactobacillus brevis]MBU7558769.1 nucleotidyltransferase [Levilactobacillus brevis]MBU7565527.1 nucleotidyltransferase [Levilactobacillus brevis]MCE6013369.1 nucleotidyltransferase [Levilactobacillus brevis]MCE6015727.1 nucleotidyltransferase [Levilactobacillus brevis]
MTLRAAGIVAEYNPFHNGHAYQIAQARQKTGADVIVAAMSGNWVQRGEPAIMDKWQRTEAALAGGVDLVVELSGAAALQPAHLFAQGAIAVLATLKCQWLVFGTEHPDMDYDCLMAHLPSDPAIFKRFDQTYASLFQGYLREQTGITLSAANDILGFFYAVANQQQGQPLQLVPLARQGSQHNDTAVMQGTNYASATAIRAASLAGDWATVQPVVPAKTLALLQQESLISWADFWPLLRYQLISAPVTDMRQRYQITEGVEYRLKRAALEATTFADFMRIVKTKRYTYTRLQRQAAYLLLQALPEEMRPQPQYLRVLGYSKQGQAYLHQIKKHVALPLVSRANRDWQKGVGSLDDRLGALRTLVTGIPQDYGRIPIKKPDSE